MCLLVVKPQGTEVPYEYLLNADRENPHGAGLVFSDGSRNIIEKGEKWGADEIADRLSKLKDNPAIIHFRYKTHGDQNLSNTHPFKVSRKWASAHNGVISGMPCGDDESDTRAFLRVKVKPFLKNGRNLADCDVLDIIEKEAGPGNKLAFLHCSGKYVIANEKAGHWKNGLWMSNYSYESWHSRYGNDDETFYWPPKAKHYGPKNYGEESSLVSHRYDVKELECICCGRGISGVFYLDYKKRIICEHCEIETFVF